MIPKNALFAYIRTHTRQNARSKAWFVKFREDKLSEKTLRFDTWFAAFRCWWRLKRHLFDYKPKLFRGE